MKKFKRLFLSLCVVCLTLFVLPSSIFAREFKGATWNYSLLNNGSSQGSMYYGTDWSTTHTSRSVPFNVNHISVVISGVGDSLLEVTGSLQSDMTPFINSLRVYLVEEGTSNSVYKYITWSRSEDIIQFSTTLDCTDFYPNRVYIQMEFPQSYTRTTYVRMIYLNVTPVTESDESSGIGNVNSGISNIQSDISAIGGTLNTVNSTINTVNTNVSALNESFITLNNDLKTSSDNIVGAVGAVNVGIASMADQLNGAIGVTNAGIADLVGKTQSQITLLTSIDDWLNLINVNLSLFYSDTVDYFRNFIDWFDLVVKELLNIEDQIIIESGNIINALSIHDVNTQIAINNCGNAILSGMNTLNTDIQEQMIAQTSNITNNIVSQTNALNSSIKTMENSIVTKLDDTLVVKDKNEINSNDSSTEELEGAITDYDNVEKDLVTDFNESLDSIDTDSASSIYSQYDFIKTAQFISTNMQNVYESNDFVGGMIDVTLLLGLIFTVIGIGVR